MMNSESRSDRATVETAGGRETISDTLEGRDAQLGQEGGCAVA